MNPRKREPGRPMPEEVTYVMATPERHNAAMAEGERLQKLLAPMLGLMIAQLQTRDGIASLAGVLMTQAVALFAQAGLKPEAVAAVLVPYMERVMPVVERGDGSKIEPFVLLSGNTLTITAAPPEDGK